MSRSIVVVLTSHDQLGDTGNKTGFWLEELAAPYYGYKDAGAEVTLASPKGGQPPLDAKSDAEHSQIDEAHSIRLIETCIAQGKPVASVRHAPIVLVNTKSSDGEPLGKGRQVTGFTNGEEEVGEE